MLRYKYMKCKPSVVHRCNNKIYLSGEPAALASPEGLPCADSSFKQQILSLSSSSSSLSLSFSLVAMVSKC